MSTHQHGWRMHDPPPHSRSIQTRLTQDGGDASRAARPTPRAMAAAVIARAVLQAGRDSEQLNVGYETQKIIAHP